MTIKPGFWTLSGVGYRYLNRPMLGPVNPPHCYVPGLVGWKGFGECVWVTRVPGQDTGRCRECTNKVHWNRDSDCVKTQRLTAELEAIRY